MATMTSPALDRAKSAGLTDNHIQRLTGIATDYPANASLQCLRVLGQMWGSDKEELNQHEMQFTGIAIVALSEVNRILYGTEPSVIHNVLMSTAASAVFFEKDKEQQEAEMKDSVTLLRSNGLINDEEEWFSVEALNVLEKMRATKIFVDARIAEAQRA